MTALPVLAAVGRPFLERHLPAPLLGEGPRGLLWWQWLALPAVLLLALAAGWLLSAGSRRALAQLASRTATTWDDVLLARLSGPLTAFWTIAAAFVLKGALALPAEFTEDLSHLLRAATTLAFFWAGLRAVDVGFQVLSGSPWAKAHAVGAAMLPNLRRVARIAVVVLGAVAVLGQFGVPVASLLAGLGIGGLAVALAAQKTVENLIGSVTIGLDLPFRAGDFVRVEGVEGNVETIGLRSTRVRTLDRTVITIPNGKLADSRIETFGLRDRIRMHCTLQLVYGTSAGQVRRVLQGVEGALRAHPRLEPDGLRVRLVALGAHSLDVEVMAWFRTADLLEFMAIREELLLGFLGVVEEAGTALAFPTRTVHLAQAK
jgi:MscS family membrane protein